jgi:LL-diaminopimelate aminotransferase
MAFADETTVSLVPDIYYPVHGRATGLVGGQTHLLPLRAERGFLPNLGAIPDDVLRRARILILNYPHNPTGATAPLDLYAEAVALCRRHGILFLSDLAYSELTFDGLVAPSALQVPGAKDVTIEFHSFSKTFNMAGSRIGFAVGSRHLIDTLNAIRTNMGYGTPVAIQTGAAYALDHYRELSAPTVARYERRRHALIEGFRSLGWTPEPARATMFLWLPVPAAFGAQEWTKHLIDKAGVVVTPGNAFGPGGNRFFRVSLIADEPVLATAIARMRDAVSLSEWGNLRCAGDVEFAYPAPAGKRKIPEHSRLPRMRGVSRRYISAANSISAGPFHSPDMLIHSGPFETKE